MCGLFGVINYRATTDSVIDKLVKCLAKESEDRGKDAGGVSFYKDDTLYVSRAPKAISTNGSILPEVGGSPIVMGHTRMTTQGQASFNFNNHPFPSRVAHYSMAHNGVLYNDNAIAKEFELDKTKVETDSYVVVRYLDKVHNGVINFETLKDVAERLSGTFNLTFLDDDKNLWIVKHNNPLTILDIKELGVIAYASTDAILWDSLGSFYGVDDFVDYLLGHAGKPFGKKINITSGEILKISADGKVERSTFTPKVYESYSYNYNGNYYGDDGYPLTQATGYQGYAGSWYEAQKAKEKGQVQPQKGVLGNVLKGLSSRAVFNNGTELESAFISTHTQKDKHWSTFKGCYIDAEALSVISEKQMLNTCTENMIQPLCLGWDSKKDGGGYEDVKIATSFFERIKVHPVYVKMLTNYLFKEFLEDNGLSQLFNVYAFLIWYQLVTFHKATMFIDEESLGDTYTMDFAIGTACEDVVCLKSNYNIYNHLQALSKYYLEDLGVFEIDDDVYDICSF